LKVDSYIGFNIMSSPEYCFRYVATIIIKYILYLFVIQIILINFAKDCYKLCYIIIANLLENYKTINMGKLKAALFDLDGTLFDTENQYSVFWGRMGRTYRPDVPNFENIIKGSTLTRIFNNYFPDPEIQEEITVMLDEWESQMTYEFIPGSLEFIEELRKKGVKCAVVTSSNMPKMNSVASQIPEFNSLFDRILTSEDFTASKPDPYCYLLGAKVFDAKIDECIVFEDAYNGLQAGMASGIFTVGVATNLSPDDIKDKCNYVINDFTEMSYEKVISLLM